MKWVEDCFARNTCRFTETHWYVFCFLGRSLGRPSPKFSEVLGSISRMKRMEGDVDTEAHYRFLKFLLFKKLDHAQ
jgi:hypothetical protein